MCNECGGKKHEQVPSTSKEEPKTTDQGPSFNLEGNLTGLAHRGGPVTNMKMTIQQKEQGPPEVNFDLDLKKSAGEDEKYQLTNGPTEEEKERMRNAKLNELEEDLEKVKRQLEFARRTRLEWNAQKQGLCNRRTKDVSPFKR